MRKNLHALLKYDFYYFIKTPRILILSVVAFLLSGISALTGRYFNELINFALKSEGMPPVEFDPPTIHTAYEQFFSQYNQIFVLIVIFIAVLFFAFDMSKRHYPLIFSHDVPRWLYLVSKLLVVKLVVFVALAVGGLVFMFYGFILFEKIHVLRFIGALMIYYVYLAFLMIVGALCVYATKSQFTSIIIVLAVYFAFSLLSMVQAGVFAYMPGHLLNQGFMLLEGTVRRGELLITLLVTLGLSFVLGWLTAVLFEKKALL